jgi:hypothetical protein
LPPEWNPVAVVLNRRGVQTALVGLLYLGYAVAITWPFILHPGSSIFGSVGADLTGSIARFQEFISSGQVPFLPGTLDGVDAPDGLPTTWALDLASFPGILVAWGLSVIVGPIAANGLLTIAAFTLCAFSMFLLARWVTGQTGVAIVAGAAFGFWPWVFSTSSQALGHGWVFVIVFWRALVAFERPSARNGVLLGLAAVLCMTWFQYWILIGGLFVASLAATLVVLGALRGDAWRQVRAQAAAFSVIMALGVILALLASAAAPGEIPVRAEDDAYIYSARPLMYVLPHPENPIFGRWTAPIIEDRYTGLTPDSPAYANIYLGLIMLALAAAGLVWLAGRLRRDRRAALTDRGVVAGLASVASAVVALTLSAPPRVSILGLEIPTPEELIVKSTTAFRVTHRFALVVMVGVCVLAALGLRALLANRRPALAVAVVTFLAVAVPLDLWGRQIHGALRLTDPSIYTALADKPPGTLAVYPLGPSADNLAAFYRPKHKKPIFNGYRTGTETHPMKSDFQELADPQTVARLAALGVRYVIVTDFGSQPWQPRPGQRFQGLQPMMRTSDGQLFRVTAKPAAGIASFGPGFLPPEWSPPRFLRWMSAPEAKIELRGPCDPCEGEVRFTAASFARERIVRIYGSNGELIALRRVRAVPTEISFPVRFRKRTMLTLGTLPGPESIGAVTRTADYRHVSIQVASPMSFVAAD